jgi:hypothetical protein
MTGTGHYLWGGGGGVAPKKCFSWQNFADPTFKKSKIRFLNLKYQLKYKYPPLAKNFTNGYHSIVTHVLYHFCDMSLITACEIFCSLSFMLSAHVFSLRHHLSPNISENDQDSDSD